jgi:basic membrane lipoprotein Med (substrate-binding protein (PBP1-ABC) superfamily)
MISVAVKGTLDPAKRLYLFGVESGVGTLTYNPKMPIPADIKSKLDAVEADIKSGKMKIPAFSKPGEAATVDLSTLKAN